MTIELTREQKRYETSISKDDLRTAIYIDFEGFMEQPPTLIGLSCDRHFAQIVFDKTLSSAASEKHLSLQDAQNSVSDLLRRATREKRRIVAYSQFDKNLAREKLGVDLSPVYADARLIATKWLRLIKSRNPNWRKTHPNWDIDRTLKNFLDLIGYNRPNHLGIEKTTSRIKHVKDQLIKRGSFHDLTPVAKAKWTKLLDHNRHDVLGMMKLVEMAHDGFVPDGLVRQH